MQITPQRNMLVGTGAANDIEKLSVDRFASFTVTLSAAILFGCQYESVDAENLMVGKFYVAP